MNLKWQPTKPQRKFKARAYQQNPKVDFSKLTPLEVQTLTGNRSVKTWMTDEKTGWEFRDWFYNKNYAKQLLESGAEIAVQELIGILENPDMGPRGEVTAAAKVNAAKTLLDYAGYAPAKINEKYLDQAIQDMDESQLEEFVRRNSVKVVNGGETD